MGGYRESFENTLKELGCETIADALLQRHYPARVAEKVLGGNFVRALGEIRKA